MNPLSLYYTIRSYVDSYAGVFGQRFLSIIWIVALCVLVWFYGSLVGYGDFQPLQSDRNRIILIAVIIVGWLAYLAVSYVRRRGADKALIDDVAGAGPSPEAESRAEVDILRQRLREALVLLRKVVRRRFGYVYELPWYVFMGAPGSGKTTSLMNSGLKFPLGDALNGEPVQGVGGTRNCNWWFSEEAILIDTAGRYTTHGDFRGIDRAGWNGFLKLLKRHRPSQPVNGAIVTVSIGDLMTRDPAERIEEIRAIRQRLAEMDDVLGARVPVYLLFTKADLLEGFTPFFDNLSKSDREQVWGMTFDLAASGAAEGLPDRFLAEFALLQDRVTAVLAERLQQEPDIEARGRIFRFPAALSTLREPIHEILAELCSGSRLVAAPLLRGVYLASGTQDESAVRAGVRSMQRSFFLARLFREVLFEEAALVARDPRLTRRRFLINRAAAAAGGVLACVVVAAWISAFVHNRQAIARADAAAERYAELAREVPVRDVADADFLRVLPALDALAGATDGFREPKAVPVDFGLDQAGKVGNGQRVAYGRALDALLLPRLMVQLRKDLEAETGDVAETFDTLKLYGMLGGLGPVEPGFAADRTAAMFARLYPGEGRTATRTALTHHVAALVGRPVAPLEIDNRVAAAAREKIRAQTPAERAYDLLRRDPAAGALPGWNPATALGRHGEAVFARRSAAPLTDGIDGLYTRDGFYGVVAPSIMRLAETAAREGWVKGDDGTPPEPSAIARDALDLYFSDVRARWAALLADIVVRPASDLAAMTEAARLLASPPRPLDALAAAVAAATDFRTPPAGGPADAEERLAALPVDLAAVPDPYAGLREALAAPEGGQSRFAAVGGLVDALYAQLSRAASSSAEVAAIFDVDGQLARANDALLAEARKLPPPLDQWTGGIAAEVAALAVKTARRELGDLWAADGARVCRDAIAGRYPFDRSADREVAMDDFARVFGPDGLFERFFAGKLEPFVDTSASPWTWKGSFGLAGEASEHLHQFEIARTIRRAFFPGASERPRVTLDVTPVSLSEAADAVILEIEGGRVVYFHGPVRSRSIAWPSGEGNSQSRLVFLPGGWERAEVRHGPWSPMRLFDTAKLTRVSDDRFRAAFARDGKTAVFEVQVGSVLNPFALEALADFRCPDRL